MLQVFFNNVVDCWLLSVGDRAEKLGFCSTLEQTPKIIIKGPAMRFIQGLLFPHPPVADKGSGTLPVTMKGLKKEREF